jgi:hypothetical protein
MATSNTSTAREWLRGWTLTYIPNEEEAERLAEQLHTHLETSGFGNPRLSDDIRAGLEDLMGMAQDEDARSPAAIMEGILSDHLPPETARAAAAPLASYNLNRGERTLGVDVDQEMPPALATMIEEIARPKITEEGAARIQAVYEQLGAEGLRRWLLSAN